MDPGTAIGAILVTCLILVISAYFLGRSTERARATTGARPRG